MHGWGEGVVGGAGGGYVRELSAGGGETWHSMQWPQLGKSEHL